MFRPVKMWEMFLFHQTFIFLFFVGEGGDFCLTKEPTCVPAILTPLLLSSEGSVVFRVL